jgi:hypothetical protein
LGRGGRVSAVGCAHVPGLAGNMALISKP